MTPLTVTAWLCGLAALTEAQGIPPETPLRPPSGTHVSDVNFGSFDMSSTTLTGSYGMHIEKGAAVFKRDTMVPKHKNSLTRKLAAREMERFLRLLDPA